MCGKPFDCNVMKYELFIDYEDGQESVLKNGRGRMHGEKVDAIGLPRITKDYSDF